MTIPATWDQGDILPTFLLVLSRVSGLFITFPLFTRSYFPQTVRIGLVLMLTLFWTLDENVILARHANFTNWLALGIELASEFILGAFIGYLFGAMLIPVRLAGSYVGQELGFNLGQISDPSTGAPSSEIGVLFEVLGAWLFWMGNVHHLILQTLHASLTSFLMSDEFLNASPHVLASKIDQGKGVGLVLIGPLGTCLFVAMMTMSVTMRVWPQINLFSFGIGFRILVGLAAIWYFLPYVLTGLCRYYQIEGNALVTLLLGS